MFKAFRPIVIASFCLLSLPLVLTPTVRADDADVPIVNPVAASTPISFFSRHVSFEVMDGSLRYRYIDSGPQKVTDRDLQYKLSTHVKVNLWGDGNTYVALRGESGRISRAVSTIPAWE